MCRDPSLVFPDSCDDEEDDLDDNDSKCLLRAAFTVVGVPGTTAIGGSATAAAGGCTGLRAGSVDESNCLSTDD